MIPKSYRYPNETKSFGYVKAIVDGELRYMIYARCNGLRYPVYFKNDVLSFSKHKDAIQEVLDLNKNL